MQHFTCCFFTFAQVYDWVPVVHAELALLPKRKIPVADTRRMLLAQKQSTVSFQQRVQGELADAKWMTYDEIVAIKEQPGSLGDVASQPAMGGHRREAARVHHRDGATARRDDEEPPMRAQVARVVR